MTTDATMATERRRERKERQREASTLPKMQQIEYQVPRYEVAPLSAIQKIHDESMRILSELGIDMYDEEVCDIFEAHGAKVVRGTIEVGGTVYLSEDMVMKYVQMAPSQFTQLARNPANNVIIGGNRAVFAPVYGPPFVQDLDRGRREGTIEDFRNFVKLTYMTPWLHHSGGTVCEPQDEPVATRHLDMLMAHIKYSDKAFMGSVTDPRNAVDSVKIAEIVFGAEKIRQTPGLLSLINVSSPRRYDDRMLGDMLVYAKARQALLITPFLMAGATSPVSMAGTLALKNAEALAGIALVQMISPGSPVIYGAFMTTIDLQSGAPVFGSPESQVALFAGKQMAEYYHLPYRSGGTFASSKIPDAQAGYESVQVMLPTVMAQVNFVLHAAGWLENGLVAGYEKFMIDAELCGMYHTWAKGLDVSEEALAFDAFQEVPAGGHFLGSAHTMRNFRTAFHRTDIFDYNSAEQWTINGAEDTYQRANKKWKQQLASYQPPALDVALEKELDSFIAHRKNELGYRKK